MAAFGDLIHQRGLGQRLIAALKTIPLLLRKRS
jgi:hypothetical protein